MRAFRIGLVTWNVGGAPPGIPLATRKLLACAAQNDVVVVGLQEVPVGRRGWKNYLIQALGPEWLQAGSEAYAGMRLKVFVKNAPNLNPSISVTSTGMRVGAGVADRWPNKGAVAVGIQFGPSCRALFIVAHLAANEDRVQSREDDWRVILRRLDRDEFLPRGADSVIPVPLLHRYEHVFVLGDLNYRVVAPGSTRDNRIHWVRNQIANQNWHALMAVDQLTKERLNANVFADFEEADITFAPTFKIDPQTAHYSSTRIPSYCDRILWHSLPARVHLVKPLQYRALSNFTQSDHIPVYGAFEMRVPHLPSPSYSLRPPNGYRIVLEFMLVRYIKGVRPFVKRESVDDAPHSIRRITPPFRLKPSKASRTPLTTRFRDLIENITVDDDDRPCDKAHHHLNDDDDDIDDGAESSSSLSSEDPEEFLPLVLDTREDSFDEASEFDLHDRSTRDSDASLVADFASDRNLGYNTDLLSTPGSDRRALTPVIPGVPSPVAERSSAERESDSEANTSTEFQQTPSTKKERDWNCSPGPHVNSGPKKRDSLSRQVSEGTEPSKGAVPARRPRLNTLRMEVHGEGIFLKRQRIYSISLPRNSSGSRERIGDTLPVIPLRPVKSLDELEYRHILLEFAKKKSRVGKSGVLPVRELLPCAGKPYAFEMALTKYGRPVATLEACVQLTVSDSDLWVDSQGRVVRNRHGDSARNYAGDLPVRKKTHARTKLDPRWR